MAEANAIANRLAGSFQNYHKWAVNNQLTDGERGDSVRRRDALNSVHTHHSLIITGFIRGILRGVRCTKSLRVLFLHRRSPSWTTLVLKSSIHL